MAAYRRVDDLRSPAGWLPVHRDQLRAQRSVSSMGSLYLFYLYILWWNVWNQNYSTMFCPIPIMYCITYCKLHWLQLATTISLPYCLLRRQQLDQEEFPTGYIRCYSRIFTRRLCVLLYFPHHFTVFVVNFYLRLYFRHAVAVCVCQILLKKLVTYLLT